MQWSDPRSDDSHLCRVLERVIARTGEKANRILRVTREASTCKTISDVEVLTAWAEGGRSVLFLKHPVRDPTHPDKQCAKREIRVYKKLLCDCCLPVPKYFGFRFDAGSGRYQLFLEHIDAWDLKCHDIPDWIRAARQLASLHAHFSEQSKLKTAAFLLRFDEEYLLAWTERALATTASHSSALAQRLETVLCDYPQVIDVLKRQPATLVHNDLSPKNVLIERNTSRIIFVDWELAGVGCGLMDLVHLSYGLSPADEEAMNAAYHAELAASGLVPRNRAEFERVRIACLLHKTLYRLARSSAWRLRGDTVRGWVNDVERLIARL